MKILPFKTTFSDRLYIGFLLSVLINLLWLRFLEDKLSVRFAWVSCVILVLILLKYG